MKIHCNCCGKVLQIKDNMFLEGTVLVETDWGYFSEKDGEHHTFRLCEECYDRITEGFRIPVEVSEKAELL